MTKPAYARFLRTIAGFALSTLILSFFTQTAAARAVLFQDDVFQDVLSDALKIGSNDSGTVNTAIQFGADAVPSENGNITWNVSSNIFGIDRTTAITGGISATGNANFTNASEFHMRQVALASAATCTTIKELVLDTSDNKIYVCTAIGAPGTWTSTSGGASPDFESVYTTDAGKNLVTSNGIFTINSGTNDFVIDSNDWNVTAAGALDAATITSNGLLTGSLGATVSGAAINFNASSNFVTNIGTGSTTGQVSLGGNSNCIQVDSNTWDVSCAGVMSGLTGLSSGGTVNFSTSTSFRIHEAASNPATCTVGQMYFNTTSNSVLICTATNTWSAIGATANAFVFAYDTTTQTVAVATTFQDVTYDTNAQIDGWTHTPGSATFTAGSTGTYMANVTGRVAKNGGANTTVSFRGLKNGSEIVGSQSYGTAAGSSGDTLSGNFIFSMTAGDTLKVQITGGTSNVQILPGGHGTTQPSTQFSIWRMK